MNDALEAVVERVGIVHLGVVLLGRSLTGGLLNFLHM